MRGSSGELGNPSLRGISGAIDFPHACTFTTEEGVGEVHGLHLTRVKVSEGRSAGTERERTHSEAPFLSGPRIARGAAVSRSRARRSVAVLTVPRGDRCRLPLPPIRTPGPQAPSCCSSCAC